MTDTNKNTQTAELSNKKPLFIDGVSDSTALNRYVKVEGHSNLIKETRTKAIINTNTSEYNIYMARIKQRNEQSDKLRSAVKEINTLKAELREIKELVRGIVK